MPSAQGVLSASTTPRLLYGPAMGQAIADLVLGRDTRFALDAFAPGRFTGGREAPRRA